MISFGIGVVPLSFSWFESTINKDDQSKCQ